MPRLAQRATFGIARTGGVGENCSGDLLLAFATGNRGHGTASTATRTPVVTRARCCANDAMNPLFDAVVEATEEAILNAMLAAPTMTHAAAPPTPSPTSGCSRPWRSTAGQLPAEVRTLP